MGNWAIHIEGHGIHDNGVDGDADAMLKDFTVRLRDAGHQVHAASFAVGTVKVLQDTEATTDAPAHSEYEYRP